MLSDLEMVRMYSRSRVSLGFSVVGETHRESVPIRQVRLRDFEAPMSGAFYVVEYTPEIEEFFVPGKEIVCYRSKRDLADVVCHYLTHPEEAESIRLAGHERALRDHTWQTRLRNAFGSMGLGG
jgi:spore maturation protein CgeB